MKTLKEIFLEAGMPYENFLFSATDEERDKIETITRNMVISDDMKKRVHELDKEINILLSAETWCPYVRATVPVLYWLTQQNKNISLGIITEGRGCMFMASEVNIPVEKFVVPTMAILDKDYQYIGRYKGRPQKYKKIDFNDIKQDFFAGKKSDDIIEEILDIVK